MGNKCLILTQQFEHGGLKSHNDSVALREGVLESTCGDPPGLTPFSHHDLKARTKQSSQPFAKRVGGGLLNGSRQLGRDPTKVFQSDWEFFTQRSREAARGPPNRTCPNGIGFREALRGLWAVRLRQRF